MELKDSKKANENAHNEKSAHEKLEQVVNTMTQMNHDKISSDVDGSYTGTDFDGEEPVQDADDL